jgi:hypothetical protein
VGQPTTWVLATARTQEAIFEAVRKNHTFVSWQPPLLSGPRVFLESPSETSVALGGDEVPVPADGQLALRARVENGEGAALRFVARNPAATDECNRIAAGPTACSVILNEMPILFPNQTVEITVTVPASATNYWVRADLSLPHQVNDAVVNELLVITISSPIYVGPRSR